MVLNRRLVAAVVVGVSRWGMVDGVKRGRLHKGRRLRTMGNGGVGRQTGQGGQGRKFYGCPLLLLRLASVESLRQESYGGKKKIFPGRVGNIQVEHFKNGGQ